MDGMNTKKIAGIAGVLVVVLAVVITGVREKQESVIVDTNISENASSTNPGRGEGVEVVDLSDTPVEIVRELPKPVPGVAVPATYPEFISPAIRTEVAKRFESLTILLNADPSLFNEWVELGLLRKFIEDYAGAREAWEYASKLAPKNSISFLNLGTLYGYYLQDPLAAERNFLTSIQNDKTDPGAYIKTADFYLEVMKDKSRARAIIDRGLNANPASPELVSYKEYIK